MNFDDMIRVSASLLIDEELEVKVETIEEENEEFYRGTIRIDGGVLIQEACSIQGLKESFGNMFPKDIQVVFVDPITGKEFFNEENNECWPC